MKSTTACSAAASAITWVGRGSQCRSTAQWEYGLQHQPRGDARARRPAAACRRPSAPPDSVAGASPSAAGRGRTTTTAIAGKVARRLVDQADAHPLLPPACGRARARPLPARRARQGPVGSRARPHRCRRRRIVPCARSRRAGRRASPRLGGVGIGSCGTAVTGLPAYRRTASKSASLLSTYRYNVPFATPRAEATSSIWVCR